MNEDTLAKLLDDAMSAARRALASVDLREATREITRPNASGFATVDLPAPDYVRSFWAEAERLCQLPESLALCNYLRAIDHPLRTSIRRADGQPAEGQAWERVVWSQLIHGQLQWLLYGAALEDLVVTGRYKAWHIDPAVQWLACVDIAQQHAVGRRSLRADCLIDVFVPKTGEIELEPGVCIKQLTELERCIHLTKYNREYSADDRYSPFHRGRLCVTLTDIDLSTDGGVSAVVDSIDRAKWSLCVGSLTNDVFNEGPIIIRGLDGFRAPTLRRQEHRHGSRVVTRAVGLTHDDIARAMESLQRLRHISEARFASGLRKAIWLFGRACTAVLDRDSLLDSVIGLESLLAAGPGESRYRVSLHGALLVATRDFEAAFNKLQKMYDLRSRAAHSAGTEEETFRDLAPLARAYLGRVIDSICWLVDGCKITVKDESIARNVEQWVRSLLANAWTRSS